jgi:hypothetical protein
VKSFGNITTQIKVNMTELQNELEVYKAASPLIKLAREKYKLNELEIEVLIAHIGLALGFSASKIDELRTNKRLMRKWARRFNS